MNKGKSKKHQGRLNLAGKAFAAAGLTGMLITGCGYSALNVEGLVNMAKEAAEDYLFDQTTEADSESKGIEEKSASETSASRPETMDETEETKETENDVQEDGTDEAVELFDENNLVTDAYGQSFGGRTFHIPQIHVSSAYAEQVNQEIWDTLYLGVVNDIQKYWEESGAEGGESISYTWAVNDHLLSVVIESHPHDWAWTDYYVYNISLLDGTEVTKEKLLEAQGITKEQFDETMKQALYSAHFQDLEESVYRQNDTRMIPLADQALEQSLSPENIEASIPFLNDEGELCAVCAKYTIAGAGCYYYIFNLEHYDLPEHYPDGYAEETADGS